MLTFFLIAAVVGLFICLVDWRKGMLVCIVVGFLADLVRKLILDQPVYMVVVVGIFFAVVIFGFILRHGWFQIKNMPLWQDALKIPVSLFLLWLIFEASVSLVRYGSPVLTAIGLLSYLAPIPGFLAAYYYGLKISDITRFIKFYVIFAIFMLSGIYLSYYGFDWVVLKEVGTGVIIFIPGMILDSYPGFLRSTEGAAWHAATAISLLLILVVSRAVRWPILIVALVILLLIGAGLLTGRRKMLMEIVIFASFYGAMLFYFRRGAGRIVVIGILMLGLFGGNMLWNMEEGSYRVSKRFEPYLQRGVTVFRDADDRFATTGLATIPWALRDHGIFGGGVGVASQGAQHFGGGAARFGGAGEGGLGKVVSELGLPGLGLVIWAVLSLFVYIWKLMKKVAPYNSSLVPLFYGLVAFLTANIPMFIIATQIYGDLFVLLLLGFILGFTAATAQVILITSQPYSRMKAQARQSQNIAPLMPRY